MGFFDLMFTALVVFGPAGIANLTPVIASKVPVLNRWETPMDFGRSYRGKRIFGDHKTWRGFITGVLFGTIMGLIIYYVRHPDSSLLRFTLLSISISVGALLGDAIKSFFKRRAKVAPGKAWFPFDQIDYIIGGLIFMLPFGIPPFDLVLAIFGLYFGIHLFSAYLGYLLGLKSTPI